jgi:23S rRNA (uracil1939-C5)-methyltransferase
VLAYALPEFGITMPFKPTDFTQVNPHINRVLVGRALRLLDPQPGERVIDWFCGLGNFTLPLATRPREVLGIEGSETLVQRARDNAARNGLGDKHASRRATCSRSRRPTWCAGAGRALAGRPAARRRLRAGQGRGRPARMRAGEGWQPPQRIVYVSCNPATLARDAGLLVHQAGYRCTARRRGEHVPAHGARREHGGLRARLNHEKRGPEGPRSPASAGPRAPP